MNALTIVVLFGAVAVASAGLLAAPAYAPAYAGQLSSQVSALNSGTYKQRISQSARPVAFAAPALAAPAYAAPAYAAPVAHAVAAPAVAAPAYAAPAALAIPHATAYGYTPLATSLLG